MLLSCHPSVDSVDSSPQWEPYMSLLEERCQQGGVVVSCRTASRRHFSALPRATNGRPYNRIPPLLSVFPRHPSVDFVDSSPLWEPYMPLLEERCPQGGVVASCGTAPLTSLFSTTTGDQWSPLQPYSTFQKFKKEKPLTSLFYYSPYLTPRYVSRLTISLSISLSTTNFFKLHSGPTSESRPPSPVSRCITVSSEKTSS